MIVVDASVALKWVFDEEYGDEAVALRNAPDVPIAPTLMLIEAGNALWRRVGREELNAEEAAELLRVLHGLPVGYVEEQALVAPALALATAMQHPIYECIYLALALQEDVQIATADVRFARKLIAHGHGERLRLIGEL
ncbi:type II toxin-antitoxin system VapC family toxin [Brevundimonas sp. R86498]|uniref:type II toxin-antitoxin system VapC family toxin n=1 Tax=Brevundimonas sp. R86498 TaxID=3093845 RepID=UPI0037CA4784